MPPKQSDAGERAVMETPRVVHERPKISMSLEEACREIGVSRTTLEELIRAGQIKCHNLRPGGDRRVSYQELVRYVEYREAVGVETKG